MRFSQFIAEHRRRPRPAGAVARITKAYAVAQMAGRDVATGYCRPRAVATDLVYCCEITKKRAGLWEPRMSRPPRRHAPNGSDVVNRSFSLLINKKPKHINQLSSID